MSNRKSNPKTNLKSKADTQRKRTIAISLRDRSAFLPGPPTSSRPRSDRHQLIALSLASLVAGVLMVVNCDCVTHSSPDLQRGESRHGWPWIYLTRQVIDLPVIFFQREVYHWPYPVLENEAREFSMLNLGLDLAVILLVTVASYVLISTVVYRYDRWRFRHA